MIMGGTEPWGTAARGWPPAGAARGYGWAGAAG
jgi:hypothetical protein